MEIQEIIGQLKDKFGDKVDFSQITEKLKGMDLSKFANISQVVSHLKDGGLLGDLDGDGVQESFTEEIKGKASELLGGIGNIFGK